MAGPEWRFAFRLALALGAAHPDYLLPYLTSRQFRDWMDFYELEPWGSEMEFTRSGIVASTIANCHRDSRKLAFKPKDFMPQFGKPPGQTMEETKAKMNEAMAVLKQNAKKGKKKKNG
jgi:hypothetical protein